MKEICQHIKSNVSEVLLEWENLVREQPWFSLPADHRIDSLPDVIVGLVQASLCSPTVEEAHRENIEAATVHGAHRREQGIPEHLILTEYHLLRQAIWRCLVRRFPTSHDIAPAMMRIDSAISLATNASMWGYFRPEIEGSGNWKEGIERMISSSPLVRCTPGGAMPSKGVVTT